ncbi:MAG: 4-hydroxy-tetrahydrodipicolinate reductase, partial [cyanobacterium endosymbiont of Rhopalodia fuxianensis]
MKTESLIPVVVNGAAGKMGREVVKAVFQSEDMMLVGAVDHNPDYHGQDVGEVAGCGALEIPIINDLQSILVLAAQEKV